MSLTLINPAQADDIQQRRRGSGHLGLAYIAGITEKHNIEVKVIDAKVLHLSPIDIGRMYKAFMSSVVGITAMTHEIYLAHDIAKIIKQQNPSATVVVGGPHTTALPERTLKEFPFFDIAVVGEGEKTMLDIVQNYESTNAHRSLDKIKGISYRKNGSIILNEQRPLMNSEELNNLPFPAWHLFPPQGLPVLAGRGCPFRCKFCMRVLGNKLRMRSPENVVSEIEYLYENFGRKKSWFRDETFGLNKKWTNDFLDLLEEFNRKYKIKWSWRASSRVNIADYNTYKRMHDVGCYGVDFGIESGNANILKEIAKDISLENAKRAIAIAKKAGLQTHAFFIIGHPHETIKTALDTIGFAAKLNTDGIAVGIMVPYPGTKIWEMAKSGEGDYELLSEDWRLYDKYFGNAIRLKHLSAYQLKILQSLCYLWYYLRNFKTKESWEFFKSHSIEVIAQLKTLFHIKKK